MHTPSQFRRAFNLGKTINHIVWASWLPIDNINGWRKQWKHRAVHRGAQKLHTHKDHFVLSPYPLSRSNSHAYVPATTCVSLPNVILASRIALKATLCSTECIDVPFAKDGAGWMQWHALTGVSCYLKVLCIWFVRREPLLLMSLGHISILV